MTCIQNVSEETCDDTNCNANKHRLLKCCVMCVLSNTVVKNTHGNAVCCQFFSYYSREITPHPIQTCLKAFQNRFCVSTTPIALKNYLLKMQMSFLSNVSTPGPFSVQAEAQCLTSCSCTMHILYTCTAPCLCARLEFDLHTETIYPCR